MALSGKKKVHVKIFSPKAGLFEVNIKHVDTSIMTAVLDPKCKVDPGSAKIDTLSGTVKILTYSGYYRHRLTTNDSIFRHLFNVQIIDYGDTPPCDNCMIYYNRVVFQYLDNKYGREWRDFLIGKPPGY